MTQAKPTMTRVCGACSTTRRSGYNPRTVCALCERALFAERELVCNDGGRPDLTAWVWDTEPMPRALARLDFPAAQVIYRSAAGEISSGRLALVRGTRSSKTAGTEVTGV